MLETISVQEVQWSMFTSLPNVGVYKTSIIKTVRDDVRDMYSESFS